ncbi:MAG: serine/threonine-protein kinase RsbT [Synergistales bacterium]|jgi:anti-sigma regulatory factor (Ser/Thr protein kinase)|nr:serine/threonine-protein kinase RsbT [Synergistales bacterium]
MSLNEPLVIEREVKPLDFLAAGETASEFKETLRSLGISAELCRRTSIVTYEAEMNIVIHGGGGSIAMKMEEDKITIVASDEGPGIENVELAMQEGYSTAPDFIREMGFGAGMGLPNIKKYSDELVIDTKPGKGTTLKAVIYLDSGEA